MNPDIQSNIFYGVGMECLERDDYKKALENFEKSFELMRRALTAQRIYECMMKLNRTADARQYIEVAFMLNSSSDKIAVLYANHLIIDKDTKKAVIILKNALLKNPSNELARRLLDSLQPN